MKLREILKIIENISKDKGYSQPYLCGGLVRDKYRDDLSLINDIDITTGDKTVFLLADSIFEYFSKKFDLKTRTNNDGHKSIEFANLKIDFSSNFNHPLAEQEMVKKNINVTNLLKEMYSRDFTCNALLSDMTFTKIFDPTTKGASSINEKKLIAPLSPEITFHDDKRLIRAIYLAAKLNYDLSEDCVEYLKTSDLFVNQGSFLKNKIDESLDMNAEKSLKIINDCNLWDRIPMTEKLYSFYKDKK